MIFLFCQRYKYKVLDYTSVGRFNMQNKFEVYLFARFKLTTDGGVGRLGCSETQNLPQCGLTYMMNGKWKQNIIHCYFICVLLNKLVSSCMCVFPIIDQTTKLHSKRLPCEHIHSLNLTVFDFMMLIGGLRMNSPHSQICSIISCVDCNRCSISFHGYVGKLSINCGRLHLKVESRGFIEFYSSLVI